MRALVLTDLHLDPDAPDPEFSALSAHSTDEIDLICCLGDTVDDPDPDSIAAGRSALDRLAATGVPILSIPGNHDNGAYHDRLVDGIDGVTDCHRTAVTVTDDGVCTLEEVDDALRIAGWGCEQFDQQPELRFEEYEGFDPSEYDDRDHAADRIAAEVLDVLSEYVRGTADRAAVADRLEIDDRATLAADLDRLTERYRTIAETIPDGPTLLLTHVPPYGTRLDDHHKHERGHWGSIALALAIRARTPLAAFSGHSHRQAYDTIGGTHLLNPGYRQGTVVSVDADGSFGYEPIDLRR